MEIANKCGFILLACLRSLLQKSVLFVISEIQWQNMTDFHLYLHICTVYGYVYIQLYVCNTQRCTFQIPKNSLESNCLKNE